MRRAVRLVVLTSSCIALLAGCGSPPEPSPRATSPTPAGTTTDTPGTPTVAPSAAPTQADLARVQTLLYPVSPPGGDCLSSSQGPATVLACPVTRRLASTISSVLADPNGSADPVCGCQAIDAHQTATYSPGTPPGAGTIHVTAFGQPHVAYVVVVSAGQFLVDDIIYCSPKPHSIYTGETVTAC